MYPDVKMADLTIAYKEAKAKRLLGEDPAMDRELRKQAAVEAHREQLKADGRLTLAELSETFLRRYQGLRGRTPAPKTMKEYTKHVDGIIVPEFGSYFVDELPVQKIMNGLQLRAEKAPVQANRLQATMSVIFTWAMKNGLMDINPIAGYDKVGGKEESKTRALDFDPRLQEPVDKGEIKQVWNGFDEVNPKLKYALRMILLTAQRPGEVLNTRWDDFVVNGETRWIIPDPKNRKGPHKIPVTPMFQDLLDELKSDSSDGEWLFPDNSGIKPIQAHSLAQRVRKEIDRKKSPVHKMERWTPHDLRRTVATQLGVMNFLNAEISLLLNHSQSGSVTAIYNRSDNIERIRVMLESWQKRLQNILEGKKTSNVVEMR
jgi:integrase